MDFSKDFRTFWWAVLVLCISYYFYGRFGKLQMGNPSWFDAIAFTVWIALAIGPFFKEMEFLGFKLKQEVKYLKEQVTRDLESIRLSIQNTTDNRQTMNPQFLFNYPPPDSKLSNIQEQVKIAVQSVIEKYGFPATTTTPAPTIETPSTDIDYLFRARLSIEKELRQIQRHLNQEPLRRPEPVFKITESLVKSELITNQIANAIREVYSVCSPAIHGENVTEAQIAFVKSTAPELITALKSISERYSVV